MIHDHLFWRTAVLREEWKHYNRPPLSQLFKTLGNKYRIAYLHFEAVFSGYLMKFINMDVRGIRGLTTACNQRLKALSDIQKVSVNTNVCQYDTLPIRTLSQRFIICDFWAHGILCTRCAGIICPYKGFWGEAKGSLISHGIKVFACPPHLQHCLRDSVLVTHVSTLPSPLLSMLCVRRIFLLQRPNICVSETRIFHSSPSMPHREKTHPATADRSHVVAGWVKKKVVSRQPIFHC